MAGGAYQQSLVPANATAARVGDPDTLTVNVPAGEVWYVEEAGFGPVNPSSDDAAPSNIRAGIFSAGDISEVDTIFLNNPDRGNNNRDPSSESDNVAVEAYAYPGELIAYGPDNTNNECSAYLNARVVSR